MKKCFLHFLLLIFLSLPLRGQGVGYSFLPGFVSNEGKLMPNGTIKPRPEVERAIRSIALGNGGFTGVIISPLGLAIVPSKMVFNQKDSAFLQIINQGFAAKSTKEEIKIPNASLKVLTGIADITKRFENVAQKDSLSIDDIYEIEKRIQTISLKGTRKGKEVLVSNYNYEYFVRYDYKTITDVRLVLQPDVLKNISLSKSHPLTDFLLVRLYEHSKPARTHNFVKIGLDPPEYSSNSLALSVVNHTLLGDPLALALLKLQQANTNKLMDSIGALYFYDHAWRSFALKDWFLNDWLENDFGNYAKNVNVKKSAQNLNQTLTNTGATNSPQSSLGVFVQQNQQIVNQYTVYERFMLRPSPLFGFLIEVSELILDYQTLSDKGKSDQAIEKELAWRKTQLRKSLQEAQKNFDYFFELKFVASLVASQALFRNFLLDEDLKEEYEDQNMNSRLLARYLLKEREIYDFRNLRILITNEDIEDIVDELEEYRLVNFLTQILSYAEERLITQHQNFQTHLVSKTKRLHNINVQTQPSLRFAPEADSTPRVHIGRMIRSNNLTDLKTPLNQYPFWDNVWMLEKKNDFSIYSQTTPTLGTHIPSFYTTSHKNLFLKTRGTALVNKNWELIGFSDTSETDATFSNAYLSTNTIFFFADKIFGCKYLRDEISFVKKMMPSR